MKRAYKKGGGKVNPIDIAEGDWRKNPAREKGKDV